MNKDYKTGIIFYGLSVFFTIIFFSPVLFFSRPTKELLEFGIPWMPILLIVGSFLCGTVMIWIGYRETWLRKNGIIISAKIVQFKTVSTHDGIGEFIDVKHIIAEAFIEGKNVRFFSHGLHPEKDYRMPKIGDNINVYYKSGNTKVYFVDLETLKREI